MNIKVETTHIKTLKATFNTRELNKLIADKVAAAYSDIYLTEPSVKYEVRWEDETEGSPPYKIGVRAFVTITKNMNFEYPVETPPNVPHI